MTQEWSWFAFCMGVLACSVYDVVVIVLKVVLASMQEDR